MTFVLLLIVRCLNTSLAHQTDGWLLETFELPDHTMPSSPLDLTNCPANRVKAFINGSWWCWSDLSHSTLTLQILFHVNFNFNNLGTGWKVSSKMSGVDFLSFYEKFPVVSINFFQGQLYHQQQPTTTKLITTTTMTTTTRVCVCVIIWLKYHYWCFSAQLNK